jgi:secreted PhoX family phosphatase
VVAVALVVALPASAMAARPHHVQGYNTASDAYVASTGSVPDVEIVPLINSGDEVFGAMFEGIPDGIGAVPAPGNQDYVDLYVNHEQSHVPFGGFADFVDSSVSRVRVDVTSKSVIDLDVPLPPSLGFIRFCSSFMAGPAEGFPHYTLITNEESNDIVSVPAGAPYGPDPALAPDRQAGYSVALDTRTGKVTTLDAAGRHNHENLVVVPGGWDGIYSLSGDDTFSAPSSQVYMFGSDKWQHFVKGDGSLWAFRVTATDEGSVDPADAFNDANDYLEIQPGETWSGEFIPVPDDIARGLTGEAPQTALENWSNANNVFQFVRVEDIDYDPDDPRTVYFADTGTTRLAEDPTTGRLVRLASGGVNSNGRIFKIVMNADDPTMVDEFSIVVDASDIGMRAPDNLDAGHDSLMIQEDASDSKVWMQDLASGTWTHVATATITDAETSGILDVSDWFGPGWWAIDVQVHDSSRFVDQADVPGADYDLRREDGQLLLMHVPGS